MAKRKKPYQKWGEYYIKQFGTKKLAIKEICRTIKSIANHPIGAEHQLYFWASILKFYKHN